MNTAGSWSLIDWTKAAPVVAALVGHYRRHTSCSHGRQACPAANSSGRKRFLASTRSNGLTSIARQGDANVRGRLLSASLVGGRDRKTSRSESAISTSASLAVLNSTLLLRRQFPIADDSGAC
jgi:hypothetical protein